MGDFLMRTPCRRGLVDLKTASRWTMDVRSVEGLCWGTGCDLIAGLHSKIGSDSMTTFEVAVMVGSVLEPNVTVGGGRVEPDIGTETGLVVGSEVGPAVGIDRADIGLLDLLVDLCSLDFELPNPKSLLKNPRLSTFCLTENGLSIRVTERGIFTEAGWVGFNGEDSGVWCGCKRGMFVFDVDANVAGVGPGAGCGGPKAWSLRAGLLFEVARMPPGLPSARPSASIQSIRTLVNERHWHALSKVGTDLGDFNLFRVGGPGGGPEIGIFRVIGVEIGDGFVAASTGIMGTGAEVLFGGGWGRFVGDVDSIRGGAGAGVF